MTPERLLALVLAHSPGFAPMVGGSRPAWGLLEAGWGFAALPAEAWAAFLWRYGRDGQALTALHPLLLAEARYIARREHWPEQIAGAPYLLDLVELALAEEQLTELDRDRLRRRLEHGWGAEVWTRQLERKHRVIGAVLDKWCVDAHESISRRIREQDYG